MDLGYGHAGTPVYDTESKSWHFARSLQSWRYIHPICRLFQSTTTKEHASSNTKASQQLLDAYPEFEGTFSPEDAQLSELVRTLISQYDSKVSELLAIGNAVDATHPRYGKGPQYKQLMAVASGAAGELVKFVSLNREHLKWHTDFSLKIETSTAQNGEVGWWKGNGSSIQQLVFAGDEGQASTWLAIRYQGAISVVRPTLHHDMICPSNADGPVHDLPASRLDANHVTTLTSQDASGIPFADVTFDPWDPQRFATIDQAFHWHIWIMKVQIRIHSLWTLEKESGGNFVTDDQDLSELVLDGWAKILWVNDVDTVFIASRRKIALFDISVEPVSLAVPELGLSRSSDWILDIKRTPASMHHLLLLTSTRLFLLETRPSTRRGKSLAAAAILVSWIHFRSPEDISLSMSCFDSSEPEEASQQENTTAVVVYSRLNSLASVFTFQHSDFHDRAVSKFDPCHLATSKDATNLSLFESSRENKQAPNNILCLHMNPLPVVNARASCPQDGPEGYSGMFLLRTLNRDTSVSEHLYFQSALKMQSLEPPDIRTLVGFKKTPAKITDDFIVSDCVGNDPENAGFTERATNAPSPRAESSTEQMLGVSGLGNIELGWLVGAVGEKRNSSKSQNFETCLEGAQMAVGMKGKSTRSGADTLLELTKANFSVTDIDSAATTMNILLETIAQSPSNTSKATARVSESHTMTLNSLPQAMGAALGFGAEFRLTQVYENLIQSQIGPLPSDTPSRVRIATEKQLRTLAAQLCLASYTVHLRMQGLTKADLSTQNSTFAIPVRRKGPPASSTTQSSALLSQPSGSKARATRRVQFSVGTEAASPVSTEDASLQSPTAEVSTTEEIFSEDQSSINLRTLVSLTPQPQLPPKLSNVLSHWSVGEDPASYDWEAAQRATARPDSEALAAEQARQEKAAKKAKKRARLSTLVGRGTMSQMRAADADGQTQPEVQTVLEPKSQATAVASSQMPESSQVGVGVSSQPLAGRFAGGQKGSKAKKGRKRGF